MTSVDIDRSAPVIVREEVTIAAPPEVVWGLHTDVNRWPTWHRDIDTARLDGDFVPGSQFHWTTSGLSIASTIAEVDPGRRTAWGGPAEGIEGVHVWTFTPVPEGVRVVTEESWSGPAVEAGPDTARSMLQQSIQVWLADLTRAATR